MDSDRIARIRADLDEVVSRGGWYVTNARNDIPWLLSQLESLTARAVRAESVLDAIRQHCRVVYYPLDERFRYIEHTMAANKDQWNMLLAKLSAEHAATP